MPYAVAMSAQASLDHEPSTEKERDTPEFVPNPLSEFEPGKREDGRPSLLAVLTPKSEAALIQNRIAARLARDSGSSSRRRVSEPLALRGRPPPGVVQPLQPPLPSPVEVPRPLFLRCSTDSSKRSSFNSVDQLLSESILTSSLKLVLMC